MLKKFVRTMAYIGGIVTGFYLFASAPGIHKKKKWQHLTGWDYAHRGLYDNASRRIPWRHFVGQWIRAMALNWMFI